MDSDAHLSALKTLLDALDDWRDFEQSEAWREYFPKPIWGDKHPPHASHPVWLAMVDIQQFYRGNRLPHEVIGAWSNLCFYSRQHGNEDRRTQRDLAVENAEKLRSWVDGEIAGLETAYLRTSQANGGNPYPSPRTYARDKWIYENIGRNTYDTLSLKLREKAKAEKWHIISSRNGFKKAADRYAHYHSVERRRFAAE